MPELGNLPGTTKHHRDPGEPPRRDVASIARTVSVICSRKNSKHFNVICLAASSGMPRPVSKSVQERQIGAMRQTLLEGSRERTCQADESTIFRIKLASTDQIAYRQSGFRAVELPAFSW